MSLKKIFKYILLAIVVYVVSVLVYLFFAPVPKLLNEIPMYGRESYEQHVKERIEEHKLADEEFVNSVVSDGEFKDLREASSAFCAFSSEFFNEGDYSTAMKRNNQAWLIDQSNPCVFANFGAHYMFVENNMEKSIAMYDKAVDLAVKDEDRNWILIDYAEVLLACHNIDNARKDCLEKANSYINESKKINESPKTFRISALYYYEAEEYEKSWENVHLAILSGVPIGVMEGFIMELKIKMEDPKNIY